MDFSALWGKVERHAGETFYELGGKTFTYEVGPEGLQPSTAEAPIPRDIFEQVYAHGPVPPPRRLAEQGLGSRQASYVFSILTDPRLKTD
jgi:hypothetical protein